MVLDNDLVFQIVTKNQRRGRQPIKIYFAVNKLTMANGYLEIW